MTTGLRGFQRFQQFRMGLKDSLPIAAGYLPIAFAFGVAAVQAGISPILTTLISVLVFAGGSQFVLISLLTAGGTVWTIAPTILLLNARHLLYGQPILRLLASSRRSLSPVLLAFGLTDEVFATAVTRMNGIAPEAREHWYVGVQLGAYLAWIVGTVLGCFMGTELLKQFPALEAGLSFVLPAFFFSLLLMMKEHDGAQAPIGVGALVTGLLLLWVSASVAIPVGLVVGAATGAVLEEMRHAQC
jgi:4-azaleucine resistance transporter AzlC